MKNPPVFETLQTATAIAKTTQTLIGKIIPVGGYDYITLFADYTKGDETGLIIGASVLQAIDGTAYPYMEWSSAAGTKTRTASNWTLTASASSFITLDVRGLAFIKFTQGGSANDGTPTGTLAASYTLK